MGSEVVPGLAQPTEHFTVRYHEEDGSWWATCDRLRWTGTGRTLAELRQRAAEGIRFVLSDGGEIEPPARSLMFVRWFRNPHLAVDADAVETFQLESPVPGPSQPPPSPGPAPVPPAPAPGPVPPSQPVR